MYTLTTLYKYIYIGDVEGLLLFLRCGVARWHQSAPFN